MTDYPTEVGVQAGDCYFCHTGKCPVGVATQDPELIKRLEIESDPAGTPVRLTKRSNIEVQELAFFYAGHS